VTCEVSLAEHSCRTVCRLPVLRLLRLTDDTGTVLGGVTVGKPVCFELELDANELLRGACIGLHVYDVQARRVMSCHSGYQTKNLTYSLGQIADPVQIAFLSPYAGRYTIVVGLSIANENIDRIDPAMEFRSGSGRRYTEPVSCFQIRGCFSAGG